MRLLIAVVLFVSFFLETGLGQSPCSETSMFTCDDNTCISRARTCDLSHDCPNGEDKSAKAECGNLWCAPRNISQATENRYPCRRTTCNPRRNVHGCRGRKECICDDECGFSCISPNLMCASDPPTIPNSRGYDVIRETAEGRTVLQDPLVFKHKDMIRYRCVPGRVLVGPLVRCTSKRTWTTLLPQCKVITCERPTPPGHGTILHLESVVPEYGIQIMYQCDSGYKIKGSDVATCNEDGNWGEVPECVENADCQFTRSTPLFCGYTARNWIRVLTTDYRGLNGYAAQSGEGRSTLESMTLPADLADDFICLSFRYKLVRGRTILVESINDYTPFVTTHEDEEISTWLNAAVTINARRPVKFRFRTNGGGVYLDDIFVEHTACDDHCIDSPCRNGGTCFNRKEDYTCFCRRFFEGRSCQFDLRCQEPLERTDHGSRISLSGNLLPGNGTALYKCDAGYRFASGLSTKKIDCIQRSGQMKGQWSSSLSTLRCEEITCRLPASDQHRRLLNPKAKWLVGDTAEYQCESGYIALDESGRSSIRGDVVCLSSQQWSNGPPLCIRRSQSLCDGFSRFRCRNGACISTAKRCNGFQDCEGGEDEEECRYSYTHLVLRDEVPICKPRNLDIAKRNNYTCKSPCDPSRRWTTVGRHGKRRLLGCRGPKKRCVCDDECGWSCINPDSQCGADPPEVPNATVEVRKMDPETKKLRPHDFGPPYDFQDVAVYTCNDGTKLDGPFPRCSGRKTWSNEIPMCKVIMHPEGEINHGRRVGIRGSDTGRAHEIYFMFDVSASVINDNKRDLKDEIVFAKRLVERMKRFGGKISYGIMVFASKNVTALDIADGQTDPRRIIEELDNIYRRAAAKYFQRATRLTTNTAYALNQLRRQMGHTRDTQEGDTVRHIFLFTDGRHTEGWDPVETRKDLELEFTDDHCTIEFYSITSCAKCNFEVGEELKGLSTGENGENYIYIEDFYQMDTYLDRVTNVAIDYSECGQAGKVGPTVNQQAQLQLGRSVGGENAEANAWPWQALFVRRGNGIEQSLEKGYLIGGGSILSEHWILTAAHVFKSIDGARNWKRRFAVFVGIFERRVLGPVEAYAIAEYHSHPNYEDETTTGYDIALIKLGKRLDGTMREALDAERDGLTFTYYIRPVCLPCTGTCLKKKHLVNGRNEPLVSDDMGFDEKCKVEENLLHENDAKAVVTGYGHLNYSEINRLSSRVFNPPRKLQQALLKILPDEKCRTGVDEINARIEDDYVYDEDDEDVGRTPAEYSDTMLCCESAIKDKTIDACKGDNGGPLVRGVRDFETQQSCWVQIGIVSWGYGCGLKFPGYYTRVTKFIPWINETIGGTLPGI